MSGFLAGFFGRRANRTTLSYDAGPQPIDADTIESLIQKMDSSVVALRTCPPPASSGLALSLPRI